MGAAYNKSVTCQAFLAWSFGHSVQVELRRASTARA